MLGTGSNFSSVGTSSSRPPRNKMLWEIEQMLDGNTEEMFCITEKK